jgi:hypothetical protein
MDISQIVELGVLEDQEVDVQHTLTEENDT